MNLDLVRELVRMMEASSLTAMEVQDAGFRVRLENMNKWGYGNSAAVIGGSDGTAILSGASVPLRPGSTPIAVGEVVAEKGEAPVEDGLDAEPLEDSVGGIPTGKHLLSPMVGTFHELPEDRKVGVGARLKKGDPVCVVEAMKVMNEILMEEDGAIAYIAAKEGDMVEYDQVLYVFD